MARRTVGPTRRPRGRRSFAPLVLRRVRESFPAIVRKSDRPTGRATGRRLGRPSGRPRDGSASRPGVRSLTRRSYRRRVLLVGQRSRRSCDRWFVRGHGPSLGVAAGGSTGSSVLRSVLLPPLRPVDRLRGVSVPRWGGRSCRRRLDSPVYRNAGGAAGLAVRLAALRTSTTPSPRPVKRSTPRLARHPLRRACDQARVPCLGWPDFHLAGPATGAPGGPAPSDAHVRSTGDTRGRRVPRADRRPADRTHAPWSAPVTRHSSPHTTGETRTTSTTVAGVLSTERADRQPLFLARSRPCIRWGMRWFARRVGPTCLLQVVRQS